MAQKTKKNGGALSELLPCTAGYRLPAFLTPFLMIGEVALDGRCVGILTKGFADIMVERVVERRHL